MNKAWKKEIIILLGILFVGIVIFFWIGDAWRIREKNVKQVEIIFENGRKYLYSKRNEISVILKHLRKEDFTIYIPFLCKCEPQNVTFHFLLNNGKRITLNYDMITADDLIEKLDAL